MNFHDTLKHYQARTESELLTLLPPESSNPLTAAMSYSALNGGKRLRPILVYIIGKLLGASLDKLDAPACSIELMHSYSLIHDDLPAMDDDDLRRGKPTCHKVFGEAMAILAGDALQSLSFELLTRSPSPLSFSQQAHMVNTLAKAAGASQGMALGQGLDIENNPNLTLKDLNIINKAKTSSLIEAAVQLGIIAANCNNEKTLENLNQYAQCIGLAFQIHDDLLDIENDPTVSGKNIGSDRKKGKKTYPDILGLEQAKQKTIALHQEAIQHLKSISFDHSFLSDLSKYILLREN